MRLFLPLVLATACSPLRPPASFTVEWPDNGDGFCIDALGEGRATAGPIAIPVAVSGERTNGRVVELDGVAIELVRLLEQDDGTLESERLSSALLDASGRATLQLDVPEPPDDGTSPLMDLLLMVETDGGFSVADTNNALLIEAVASDQVPWIGCQEWQNASGTPIPADGALRVGTDVLLSFHVEGDPGDDAPEAEIIFRERGGDLCGPDPFGTFTTPVVEGANAVSWRVSLEGMDVCESENDESELTFSTPSHLDAEGSWQGTRESADRDVLP